MNANVPEQQAAYDEGKRAGRAGKGLYYSGPHTQDFLNGAKAGRAEREAMMSDKAKWMPGPWRYSPPLGEGNHAILSEKVNSGGNFYVAICTPDKPTVEADARLIAAAPAMAEALRDAAQALRLVEQNNPKAMKWLNRELVGRCEAALRDAGVEV